jgi:hypothetical protein
MESPQDNDTMLLDRSKFNFTPWLNGTRCRMRISEEDRAKIRRGPGFYGFVVDLDDGKKYAVAGRECGLLGCFCDAEAFEV